MVRCSASQERKRSPISLHFSLAYHAVVLALLVTATAAALSLPAPADRLHAAAVLVAIDGDHEEVARSLVESALDDLRGPLGGGEYRWAAWVAGGGPAVREETRVRAVDGGESQVVKVEATHASRIVVQVAKRRSLFSGNYPCTVTSVVWRCPAWSREENPLAERRRLARGDRLAFDLGAVCPAVVVEVGATTEQATSGDSELTVEVETGHLEDDRASPHFETAQTLSRFLAATVTLPDERWSQELRDAARRLGHRPPRLRADLQRIQRLLDGSERERRLGRELLDELISDLP